MLLWTVRCMCYLQLVFLFLSDIYPGVELLGHMVVLFLVFWETCILFLTVVEPVYIPTNNVQGFHFFFTSSPTIIIYILFDNSHSDRWGGYLITILICISLMISVTEYRFTLLLAICILSSQRNKMRKQNKRKQIGNKVAKLTVCK